MDEEETDQDNFDRLGDKAGDWAEKQAGKLADHPVRTGIRWGIVAIAVVVVIAVVGGIIGLVGNWGSEAKHVVGPANVTNQYKVIIDDWQSLMTAADNACGAQNTTPASGDPTLVENPAFAYAATYRKIRTDYNLHFHDVFEGGLVGPRGYPKTVPDLAGTHGTGDWCQVSSQLAALHN